MGQRALQRSENTADQIRLQQWHFVCVLAVTEPKALHMLGTCFTIIHPRDG